MYEIWGIYGFSSPTFSSVSKSYARPEGKQFSAGWSSVRNVHMRAAWAGDPSISLHHSAGCVADGFADGSAAAIESCPTASENHSAELEGNPRYPRDLFLACGWPGKPGGLR